MNNVIELDQAIDKKANTFLWCTVFTAKAAIALVGAVFALQAWDEGKSRFLAAKESYINSEISEALAGKTFEFDNKRAIAKPATAMSPDELLRALYLLNRQAEERESTINHLKEILSYE